MFPCVTDDQTSQSEPLGWIVTVATPQVGGSGSSLEVYFVAISDQVDAIEAVRAATCPGQGALIVAHQDISKSLMAALALKPGDVSQG